MRAYTYDVKEVKKCILFAYNDVYPLIVVKRISRDNIYIYIYIIHKRYSTYYIIV